MKTGSCLCEQLLLKLRSPSRRSPFHPGRTLTLHHASVGWHVLFPLLKFAQTALSVSIWQIITSCQQ